MESPESKAQPKGRMRAIATVVVCFAVLWAAVSYAGFVVTPKNNGEGDGVIKQHIVSIYAEPTNTLDVVFVGNSVMAEAISPFGIYEKTGITSYMAAFNGMRSYSAYSWLNKIDAVQSPKVVVFDADVLYNEYQPGYALFQMIDDAVPLAEYHHRWKNVTPEDFYTPINYTHLDATKGHIIREQVKAADADGYMDRGSDYIACGPISEWCLRAMKEKCDLMGAQFVVVAVPTVHYWNRGKHNYLEELSQKYDFTFVDMNTRKAIDIDWSSDTRDHGVHLNWKGSKKATSFMAERLKEIDPSLEDRRGDPAYKESWDDQLPLYHEALERVKSGDLVFDITNKNG